MYKPLETVLRSIAFVPSMRPPPCHRKLRFCNKLFTNRYIKRAKSYHATLWFSCSAKSRHFFCNCTFWCKMRFVTSSRHVGLISDIFVTKNFNDFEYWPIYCEWATKMCIKIRFKFCKFFGAASDSNFNKTQFVRLI